MGHDQVWCLRKRLNSTIRSRTITTLNNCKRRYGLSRLRHRLHRNACLRCGYNFSAFWPSPDNIPLQSFTCSLIAIITSNSVILPSLAPNQKNIPVIRVNRLFEGKHHEKQPPDAQSNYLHRITRCTRDTNTKQQKNKQNVPECSLAFPLLLGVRGIGLSQKERKQRQTQARYCKTIFFYSSQRKRNITDGVLFLRRIVKQSDHQIWAFVMTSIGEKRRARETLKGFAAVSIFVVSGSSKGSTVLWCLLL